MNLFDFLEEEAPVSRVESAVVAALAAMPIGALVRHADGRRGRVVLFVPATDRVFIRFQNLERPEPVNRIELEVVGPPCPHASWVDGETVWPGIGLRLTQTCRDCGEVKGRT